jgi:hypothetical protein
MTLTILPVAGKDVGQCMHYSASRIRIPESLHKHILRLALSAATANVADRIAETRYDNPELCAYISAEGLKSGRCGSQELRELADSLNQLCMDDEDMDEGTSAPALIRLADECKKHGGNLGMELEMAGF